MKTFLLLTLSLTSMLTYPSEKRPTFIYPRSIFKISAIYSARVRLEFPEKMSIFVLLKHGGT